MCGVLGIVGNRDIAKEVRLGIHELQHRGEQGAGIVVFDGQNYGYRKGLGLVTEAISDKEIESLFGNFGIGHVRYSTVGDLKENEVSANLQPLQGEFRGEQFWLCHNGNLVRLRPLRQEAESRGYRFKTTSDTEVIVALLSVSEKRDFIEALLDVLPKLEGAFSLVILYKNKVIGVRDRFGIRPLCLGHNESSFILASESCVFHALQSRLIDDVQPGELIILDEHGIDTSRFGQRPFIWAGSAQLRVCIFEFVYFARPDSIIDGQSVYAYREKAGELLAKDHPVQADIVIPVPDSGRYYDIGFSRVSGIPREEGIFRSRYSVTRTFLAQRSVDRAALQRIKLRVLEEAVRGKRVVALEDSIIRANVAPAIVSMLREAGATEVHLRIGSSPVCSTCHLGIDIPTRKELIGSSLSIEEIGRYIGTDSLAYLSPERMVEASGLPKENLSMGCFTGEYAVLPE